jgi:hypothetical protein
MRRAPWDILRAWGMLLAIAASVGLAGCGPASGTISGKVSYKGAILKGGNVSFVSADGKIAKSSPIAEDGSYSIEKMPVGTVKISVETKTLEQAAKARRNDPPPGQTRPGDKTQSDPAEAAKRYVPIPEKYADPNTSELTYTVTSGTQPHDIELK